MLHPLYPICQSCNPPRVQVYIVQPNLLPLAERIALGDWERFEELCIKFVAYSRARERLILLSHLEVFNRQNILGLWDKPEHSPEPPSDAPPLDEAEEADPVAEKEAMIVSLGLLGLQTLPSSEAAINEAFKKAIRKGHPDRHFGSQAATEHSRMLLEARAILKKALIIEG